MNKTPAKISPAELEEQEEAREIVFQHGIMCQVSLPRRVVIRMAAAAPVPVRAAARPRC